MSTIRSGNAAPGAIRTCPHCRASILARASVCPQCKHHLRFDPSRVTAGAPPAGVSALRVEGTIRHPSGAPPWEYSVLISIKNERGEEVARQVVGVGALHPGDERTFTLDVEVLGKD